MPIDDWLVFAFLMLLTSVFLCGVLPVILRLRNDRQRFHRYDLERQTIVYSSPSVFLTSQSIYHDIQADLDRFELPNQPMPYIDDDITLNVF